MYVSLSLDELIHVAFNKNNGNGKYIHLWKICLANPSKTLIHCGPMTLYDIIVLHQYCLWWSFVAVQHRTISWLNNADRQIASEIIFKDDDRLTQVRMS